MKFIKKRTETGRKPSRILLFLFLFPALLLCALFLFLCTDGEKEQTADETFKTFTSRLFLSNVSSNTLTLHYTLADPEAAGITDAPVSFGEYSASAKERSAAALENALDTLCSFPKEELSASNRLTYDILRVQIQSELALAEYPYYEEILSPLLGTQAQLPILLAEYSFSSREDIETYLALLEQIDSYYESLLAYEREKAEAGLFMPEETAEAVITQCRDFVSDPGSHFLLSSFEERLAQADFLSEEERKTYAEANRARVIGHVLPAYELLADGLEELKTCGTNPYGLCYYPEGAAYYEALIDCTIGSGRSMTEIRNLIDGQLLSDARLMADIITRRPELLTHLSRQIESQAPEDILAELQEAIQADFPAVNSASCTVKYVAPSLESYLSPAFYLTPPLDQMNRHVIYINQGADYDELTLFTTLAHEGWPGHLYQTMYEDSLKLDPVRNIFYFGGYVEGWAAYAERYAYRFTSLDSDSAELLAANSFLLLGLYARADTGIHYEGWKPEDLAAYLEAFGITDETALDSIYQAIVQNPANYLKYYLGAVEILELKKEAQETFGEHFAIKDFHEFILSIGPAPFSVIRDYLYGWTGTD